jgi:hypothetical protein
MPCLDDGKRAANRPMVRHLLPRRFDDVVDLEPVASVHQFLHFAPDAEPVAFGKWLFDGHSNKRMTTCFIIHYLSWQDATGLGHLSEMPVIRSHRRLVCGQQRDGATFCPTGESTLLA